MLDSNTSNQIVKTHNDCDPKFDLIILNKIGELRLCLTSLIDVLDNHDEATWRAVKDALGEAGENLAEASSLLEDPGYTKRKYGLDIETYSRQLLFGGSYV